MSNFRQQHQVQTGSRNSKSGSTNKLATETDTDAISVAIQTQNIATAAEITLILFSVTKLLYPVSVYHLGISGWRKRRTRIILL